MDWKPAKVCVAIIIAMAASNESEKVTEQAVTECETESTQRSRTPDYFFSLGVEARSWLVHGIAVNIEC